MRGGRTMLHLIESEMGRDNGRGRRAMKKAITRLGKTAAYNMPYAPWLVESDQPVDVMLRAIDKAVETATPEGAKRRLLGIPLAPGTCRGYDDTRAWPRELKLRHGEEVLVIAYTLWHRATKAERDALDSAIKERYPDCCEPFETLWLVSTDEAPTAVLDHLEPFLPDRGEAQRDGLLVAVASDTAAESGLNGRRSVGTVAATDPRRVNPVAWMEQHGIAVKHVRAQERKVA
jgi:hypothetical protein